VAFSFFFFFFFFFWEHDAIECLDEVNAPAHMRGEGAAKAEKDENG